MTIDNEAARALYEKFSRIPLAPLLWELDGLGGRATEHSIYRKRAIASLHLADDSVVLDAACGPGLNFKVLESYLGDEGRLVGVDFAAAGLEMARKKAQRQGWTNIELVHASIVDYEPGFLFDAVLCTFALEIMPEYEAAIDKMFSLLKPQGRFAMIGMKRTARKPYTLLNPVMAWGSRVGAIDLSRDAAAYIRSKCTTVDYEECYGGFYYILSTRCPVHQSLSVAQVREK
jgi:2-polyprenyl-3-methyl-5-hydroxy-6-metoxy-1,4-benzoquinol methylase